MSWNGGMSYGNQGGGAPGYGYSQYGGHQQQPVGHTATPPQFNGVPMYVQQNQGYNNYNSATGSPQATSHSNSSYNQGPTPTGSYSPSPSYQQTSQPSYNTGYSSPNTYGSAPGNSFAGAPSYGSYGAPAPMPPTNSSSYTPNNYQGQYNGGNGSYNGGVGSYSPQQSHNPPPQYNASSNAQYTQQPQQDYGYGQTAPAGSNSVQARANALNYGNSGPSAPPTTSNYGQPPASYTPPVPSTQYGYNQAPPTGFGPSPTSNNASSNNASSFSSTPSAHLNASPSSSPSTARAMSPPPVPKRGPVTVSSANSTGATPPALPKKGNVPVPPAASPKDAQIAKTTASNAAAKRSFPLPPSSGPSTPTSNSPAGPSPSSSANSLKTSVEAPSAVHVGPGARSFSGGIVASSGTPTSSSGTTSPTLGGSSGIPGSKFTFKPQGGTASSSSPVISSKAKTGEPSSASGAPSSSSGGQTSPRGYGGGVKSTSPTPSSGGNVVGSNSSMLVRAASKGALPRYGINANGSGSGNNAYPSTTSSSTAPVSIPSKFGNSATGGSSSPSSSNTSVDASFNVASRETTAPSGTVLSGIAAFSGSSPSSTGGTSPQSSLPSTSGNAIASAMASQNIHQHKHAHSSPSAIGPSNPGSSSSAAAAASASSPQARAASPARTVLTARSASSGNANDGDNNGKSSSNRSVSPAAPMDSSMTSGKASKYLQFSSLNANLSDLPSQLWKSKYAILHTIHVVGSPKLAVMSPKLSGLKSLTSLTFRGCGLTSVSTSIDHLGGNLLKLDIGENKLDSLPDWIGTVFTGLQQLSIDRNSLKALPPSVGRLTHLRSLDVAFNHFPTLDHHLANLTQLQLLSVAHNNLVQMPPCLDKMKSLTAVDISDNKVRGPLPTALLSSLRQLTSLNVGQNNLGDVTTEICLLAPKLTSLHWNDNKAKSVHDALWTLTKLQRLSLGGNMLTDISEKVSRLTNLTELSLDNNQFDILPHQLFALPLLNPQSLSINPNPFRSIPSEVRSSASPTAIYRFLAQLSEKAPWRRMKLMLVGNGNIGKTSLKRALSSSAFSNASSSSSSKAISKIKGKAKDAFKRIGESFSGSSSSTDKLSSSPGSRDTLQGQGESSFDPTDTIATDGIDIDDWVVDLEDYQECIPEDKDSASSNVKRDMDADGDVQQQVAVLSCYDFAGQDVYYPTHSLFVTSRSIYLVMFSLKDLEGSRVEYWLQMVLAKAGYTSPVVIVATHEDDKSVDKTTIPDILAATKKKYSRFPFVKGVVSISSKTGSGIPQLRKLILTLALSHPTMKEQVPRSYLLLEEEIKKRRRLCGSSSLPGAESTSPSASHDQQTVSLDEWHAMAERCFFKSKEDSMAALQFLADVGVVFYFKSDAQSGSSLPLSFSTTSSKVVASSGPAQGLENIVVLDPQWIADLLSTVISLKHNYIREGVLDESVLPHLWKLYPRELHADLLSLLKRFEIVLPMALPGKFMVPSMLPKDEVILSSSSGSIVGHGSAGSTEMVHSASVGSNPSLATSHSPASSTSSSNTSNPLFAGLGGGIGATARQRTATTSHGSSAPGSQSNISISAPIANSGSASSISVGSRSEESSSIGESNLALFNRLWMSRDKWYGPMGTVVSMKFCPMGFFGRFVARALHLPSLKVVSYSMSTFVAEHSQTGERVSVMYNEWTYEVLLFSASPRPLASSSRNLLFAVTDCMEILHESLYSSNRRSVFVVCPHCVSEGFSSPTLFLLEDALIAFTERVTSLPCTQCAMIGGDSPTANSEPGSVASSSPLSSPSFSHASNTSNSAAALPPASLKRKFSVFHNAAGKKGGPSSSPSSEAPSPVTASASSPHLANTSGSGSSSNLLPGLVQSDGIIDQASGQYLFFSNAPIFTDFPHKKDKCKSKSVFLATDDEDSSEMESSGSNATVGSFRTSNDTDSHGISGMSTSTSSSNDSEPGTNSIVFSHRARTGSFSNAAQSSNSANQSTGGMSQGSSGASSLNSKPSSMKLSVRGRIEVPLEKIAPDVSFHSLDHLLVPYEAITMENLIATGGFAEIFKSKYKGETVAVKRFLSSSETGGGHGMSGASVSDEFTESFRELQHEAFLMAKLSHPNVVTLKALCVRPICMVMEYVPHGTLGGLLWGKEARMLPWTTRLKYAHDIASGLAYLHSLNIMHLDFRSLNLLVFDQDPSAAVCIKVADFGLSTHSSGSHKGIKAFNPFWSSPEILNRSTYSLSTDIYSLGIVMWELLQQGRPFEEHRANYPGPEIVLTGAIANNNLRPSFPQSTPEAFKQLITQCWANDPSSRPAASDVVRSLDSIIFAYQKKPSSWSDPLFNPPPPEDL